MEGATEEFKPVIHVEGKTIYPREIKARMAIASEDWVPHQPSRLAKLLGFASYGDWLYGPEHARAEIEVEVDVDDESGADCALWPHLRMLFQPGRWSGSDFSALAGQSFVQGEDAVSFEAFYGNDSPAFENNRVQFEAGDQHGTLRLDWDAQFRWFPKDPLQPFHFSGLIRIEGLWLSLKRDEDLHPILTATLPGFDLASLQEPEITDQNYSAPMPKARRNWRHYWFAA